MAAFLVFSPGATLRVWLAGGGEDSFVPGAGKGTGRAVAGLRTLRGLILKEL